MATIPGSSRVWRDGVLVGSDLGPREIAAAVRDPSALVWLDVVRPTPERLAQLGEWLDLRATALEDAVAPMERPKVTRHDSHLFFTTYATRLEPATGPDADPASGRLRTSRVSGFVLPRVLVTVRLDDGLDLAPVLAAWDENAHLLAAGSVALVHGLLDVVVDGHFETIQQLDDRVEVLEDSLFEERRTGREFLRQVYGLRKDLVALRRVVLPMREVVNGLLRHRAMFAAGPDAGFPRPGPSFGAGGPGGPGGPGALLGGPGGPGAGPDGLGGGPRPPGFPNPGGMPAPGAAKEAPAAHRPPAEADDVPEGGPVHSAHAAPASDAARAAAIELDSWFDDLYDHVLRAGEWTESLRDMVTSLFETNLSLQDSRLNTVMKQLAAWAAIIAVPTAITGWYGQNVPYPGFDATWGFWMSTVLVIACPFALWWVFRRRDWL